MNHLSLEANGKSDTNSFHFYSQKLLFVDKRLGE